METMFWIWMAAALIFLIVEVGVPGLIFVCFATGSVCAAIYAEMNPESYLTQIAIFGVVTILLVPMTRKFAKKISIESAPDSNIDALIGQLAVVVKEIIPLEGTGQVRIQGEVWGAKAESPIETGRRVKVTGVDGNRLLVELGDSDAPTA